MTPEDCDKLCKDLGDMAGKVRAKHIKSWSSEITESDSFAKVTPRTMMITGNSLPATVFLNWLLYASDGGSQEEGWYYLHARQWTENTGLTPEMQMTARKCLKTRGLIEERHGRFNQLEWRLTPQVFQALCNPTMFAAQFEKPQTVTRPPRKQARNVTLDAENTSINDVQSTPIVEDYPKPELANAQNQIWALPETRLGEPPKLELGITQNQIQETPETRVGDYPKPELANAQNQIWALPNTTKNTTENAIEEVSSKDTNTSGAASAPGAIFSSAPENLCVHPETTDELNSEQESAEERKTRLAREHARRAVEPIPWYRRPKVEQETPLDSALYESNTDRSLRLQNQYGMKEFLDAQKRVPHGVSTNAKARLEQVEQILKQERYARRMAVLEPVSACDAEQTYQST